MQWLADKSKHLTPSTFHLEVQKLQREVRIVVVHIKAAFHEETTGELEQLGIRTLEIASPGPPYIF
ncbi:MAG TPA: hypothetical protein VML55_07735 [Planctomycetaceae bacterium]|nr:hypothetical protein [Planctomycetaceae bacterium]